MKIGMVARDGKQPDKRQQARAVSKAGTTKRGATESGGWSGTD